MNQDEFRALVDEVAAFRADHGGGPLTDADRAAIVLGAGEYAAFVAEQVCRTPVGQRPRRARKAAS